MITKHHACLVRLDNLAVDEALKIYGEVDDSVEIRKISFESIGIGEVRKIISDANLRPNYGDTCLLVVVAKFITFEAEQALLKVLEEPPLSTKFLFVIPNSLSLLSTLESRFFDLSLPSSSPAPKSEVFLDFLAMNYADRMKEVASRMLKKDATWQEEIKKGLGIFLANQKDISVEKLKILGMVLKTLGTRGASNKMLLEELSLSLPYSVKNR